MFTEVVQSCQDFILVACRDTIRNIFVALHPSLSPMLIHAHTCVYERVRICVHVLESVSDVCMADIWRQ